MIVVRPTTPDDQCWTSDTLRLGRGSTTVARLGVPVDAAVLPGFVAELGVRRAGLVTYVVGTDGVETVTLQSLARGQGVGRALFDRVHKMVLELRAPRLWLITANDNLLAIGFHQRWGMDLVRLVHNGVKRSPRAKPSIPGVAGNGIPSRHELEFDLALTVP